MSQYGGFPAEQFKEAAVTRLGTGGAGPEISSNIALRPVFGGSQRAFVDMSRCWHGSSNDPYVRGRVIALWLDGAIRRESRGEHSLDDVMFDMVRTGDQPITLARILDTAARYLSADGRGVLQRAVVDHGGLPAPDQAPSIGGCVRPYLQDLPTFELGLDLASSRATRQITSVVEGGPAFEAGLRDGQSLASVSVNKGDPDRLAKFTIHTGAGDRQITYYPRGKAVAAWQYRLDQSGTCGQVP